MEKIMVPISEKYTLTVNEAAEYFNIGTKRIRRILAENPDKFTIACGNKLLIIRHKFETFIDETTAIELVFICRK
ncbi:MAG: excisionase [Lachnospiraceae bacterium]|nr:excisionase [Lachnospiraceae bacterium]